MIVVDGDYVNIQEGNLDDETNAVQISKWNVNLKQCHLMILDQLIAELHFLIQNKQIQLLN